MEKIFLPNAEQVRTIINVLNDEKLIMGVYWDKQANPQMIRTDASVGLVANVGKDGELVRNDFDNMPIYREIEEIEDSYGNVFVKIPKFYIQRRSGVGFKTTRISKYKHAGFYLPWCFWDFENEKELDYVLIGKYKANLSNDGLRLESKPNKHPLVNKTIVEFRDLARANNDEVNGLKGYQLFDIHVHDIICALFEVEFATLNSQSVMQGFVFGAYSNSHVATVAETNTNRIIVSNATADNFRVGQSIAVGTTIEDNNISNTPRVVTAIEVYDENNAAIYFDGDPVNIEVGHVISNRGWINGFCKDIAASSGYITANDGRYPCVYRGIESPWGDIWQFVDGVNIYNHQAWVAKNADDYASNKFTEPYEVLSYVITNANGYIRDLGYDANHQYAQLPVSVGGSATIYYCDNYYRADGQRIARVGGRWDSGADAGLWNWNQQNAPSVSVVFIGGRLVKKAL